MVGIYSNITKYLRLFNDETFGVWSETECMKKEPKSLIAPHVHYTETARCFIKDIYKFTDDEDIDVIQNSYNNMKQTIYNHEFDIEGATGDEIIYYLLWMVNSEGFCDGLLLSHYEDGTITKCLIKLKELDDKNMGIYNRKMLQTAIRGK